MAGWMDGGVGRGGEVLCMPAGWEPREDLAEIGGDLWLEEEIRMLYKLRQREMGSADLHPDLQTLQLWSEK